MELKEEDLKEIVPILIPSPDNKMDISTIINLYDICYGLNKKPMFIQSSISGLVFARQEMFRLLKNITKKDRIRGLMIDSDIIIPSKITKAIVEKIYESDKEQYNFVIPYLTSVGLSIYVKKEDKIEIMDIDSFKVAEKCYTSGLGFYYGDLPLDYKFNYCNGKGEDINFFIENRIEPNIMHGAEILHNKTMKIGIENQYW